MGKTVGAGRNMGVARTTVMAGAIAALTGAFLIPATVSAYALGNNWYVNPGGDDANSCTAPGAPCKTIAHAMSLAANGDTINLAAGTYTGTLVVTKALNIVGTAGAATTIINGGETTPSASSVSAMEVALSSGTMTMSVTGVTIQHGISAFGGGIELITGAMTVNNSIITNNEAGGIAKSTGGGGIGVLGTVLGTTQSLTLNNDQITNNKTVAFTGLTLDGGGIYSASPVTMTNTSVTGNSTAGSAFGGGVFLGKVVAADTPSLTATDSQINSNSSVVGGGISDSSGGQVTLIGDGANPSTLNSNTGTDGAGLYNAGTVTLTGTNVSTNTATAEGGGFYQSQIATTDAPVITATNTTMSGNKATTAGGGGIGITNSKFTMTGGTISGGTSAVGGGLYLASGNTATLNGGTVSGNNALDGGGIAVAGGGTATLIGTTVSSNVASAGSTANLGLGGGIFDAGSLIISGNSVLTGNQAVADTAGGSVATGWGGAVFEGASAAGNAPTFTLTNSSVIGGLSSGDNAVVGGGIAVTGNVLGTVSPGFSASVATFTGTGDTFSGNLAVEGGGAYIGGTSSFTGSTFTSNSALGTTNALGGGLLVGKVAAADPASATVDSTTFSMNTAALGAGAAVNSSSTLVLQNNTVFNQNQATNSGGGLYNGGATTITNTTFENGTGTDSSGGIFDGSVVTTDSPTLNGTNVTITGNSSPFEAGGVLVSSHATFNLTGGSIDGNTALVGGGLVVVPTAIASITGSDISTNTANGSDGGGVFNEGALTITNTSLTGNSAVRSTSAPNSTGFGGAIYSGASTTSVTTTLSLNADTLSGNTANAASAILTESTGSGDVNNSSIYDSTVTGNSTTPSFGAIDAFNPLSIVSSTVNGNTSPAGASGGIFVETPGAVSVAGSDVTGNSGGNCFRTVVDGGYNLTDAGDSTCGFTAVNHDLSGNPQLGTLGSNGGPTLTELPGASSPLINRIPVSASTPITNPVSGSAVVLCAPGSTDQRGSSRPAGPTCDIGSVEVGVSAPVLTGPSAATFLVGVAGSPLTFTSSGTPTPTLTESGALPAGVTFVNNGDGTATLAGTPATGTVGSYPITVTAANGSLPNATLPFTLTVDQAAALSGPTSDTYTVNSPGTDTFQATGTPTPGIAETGALPSGVTFTDNGNGTATLAGTPAVGTEGNYPLVITAHNGEGADSVLDFTLTVSPPVTITTTSLPGGTVGVAYATTHLIAVNGTTPYVWSVATGSLPAGLVLSSGGVISGTPTGPAGTVNFTVRVTDSAIPAGTTTQALSIVVAKGTSTLIVNSILLQMGVITFGSFSANLVGGTPPTGIAGQTVTFTTGSITLCSGVTNASGAVSCTANVVATLASILSLGVNASYAGSSSWLPSSGKAPLL